MLQRDSILSDITEARNGNDALGHLVGLCTEDSIVWYNILYSVSQCWNILKDEPKQKYLVTLSSEVNQSDGRLDYSSKKHLCPRNLQMHEEVIEKSNC